MNNDRPIEDRNLRQAIKEVRAVFDRRKLAGACIIVAVDEAAWTYAMSAPWSAIREDKTVPLGFRIRSNAAEMGADVATARLEAALHTICQLSDFGSQTMDAMEQLKAMLRRAGIEFEHRPHGGKPVGRLEPWDGGP